MNKKLTIVIPSYNTVDYIDQCLMSLVGLDTDKLEVLIIDDGSKDDTFIKAKEYEDKYPNMIKAIHKENGGHGSAINEGLLYATGEYFRVLDGDDWVDSKALFSQLEELETYDCDMMLTNIVRVFPDKQENQVFFGNLKRGVIYDVDTLPQIDFLTLGSITVRTNILREHGLKLTEHCFYEDIEFCAFCLAFVNNMVVFDLPVYMYRLGNVNQSVSKSNMVKNIDMFKKISLGLLPFFENNKPKKNNSRKELLLLRVGKLVRTTMLLHLANNNTDEGYNEWFKYNTRVKRESLDVYNYIRRKWLIIFVLCSGNKLAFKLLSRVYKKKFSL